MSSAYDVLSPWRARLLVVASLLFFFALGLRAVIALAPTADEPLHVMRSLVLWQTGQLPYQSGHAPLSHYLIGLLLPSEPSAPDLEQLAAWPGPDKLALAHELFWAHEVDVDRFLFLARLPILLSGVILGALIAGWTNAWHGRDAMAVALILFATAPNLLAGASLATTDFVSTVTYFAAVYAWWGAWRWRRRRWWFMTSLLLGLALASKLTAILLLPVLFLLTVFFIERGKPFWRPFAAYLALLPVAALVLWLVYGLQIGRVGGLLLPAYRYVESWEVILSHIESGHNAFFLGELSSKGWWNYFSVAFAIKTPLVALILPAVGLAVIILNRPMWITAVFLLLPVVALFVAAILSRLNIGYRHILPVVPFLLVTASTSVLFLRRRTVTQVLLLLMLAWAIVSTVRQQPHFLSYFNELVGGPNQGHQFLGDSNLDWGQALKILAGEVQDLDGPWQISYAGNADPRYYGIGRELLLDTSRGALAFPVANPPPGRYAISVTFWQGLLDDADTFDWFRHLDPTRTIGGSILIYDVIAQADGAWVAHCSQPFPLLSTEEAETILGLTNLRHVWFDCAQSLVLPAGDEPGWFILPQADDWWPYQVLAAGAADCLKLVYRHRASDLLPSFDIYYWPGGGLQPDDLRTRPVMTAAEGPATLYGFQVDGSVWTTFWQVKNPIKRPLSAFAHLYIKGQPEPLIGDNLGYSPEQWLPGDTFWQRFSFPITEDILYLETGLYDYQSLEALGDVIQLPATDTNDILSRIPAEGPGK
jgi:hypothetical protein